jgi:hypothetical protein
MPSQWSQSQVHLVPRSWCDCRRHGRVFEHKYNAYSFDSEEESVARGLICMRHTPLTAFGAFKGAVTRGGVLRAHGCGHTGAGSGERVLRGRKGARVQVQVQATQVHCNI